VTPADTITAQLARLEVALDLILAALDPATS